MILYDEEQLEDFHLEKMSKEILFLQQIIFNFMHTSTRI